jgi:hypothetical protein
VAGEQLLIQRRNRSVAVLIGSTEMKRLQRLFEASRPLVVVLGQDADFLRQVEAGEVYPSMAAFGLWCGWEKLSTLADEIAANRECASYCAEVAP